MKKLLLLLTIVLAITLLMPSVAFADVHWVFAFRNNTTSTVDDLHVRVWQDSSMTVPMNVTTATVLSPASWQVDSITYSNTINMSGGSVLSPGSTVTIDFITPGASGTKIWTSGDWTLSGNLVGDHFDYDVIESNYALGVQARISRSIKLTINNSEVDFGVIRPGRDYTERVLAQVDSNDNWDLYISGEDVSPFRSLLGTDTSSVQLKAGTSLNVDRNGNPIMSNIPNVGQQGAIIVQEGAIIVQDQSWEVDSFFDITYEIDLRNTRPHAGVYRALLNINAVQNY